MIVSCTVEPLKHMFGFACQSTVLNALKWRCGRPRYWHVRSLFASRVVAHLCVSCIDCGCTAAPVFDCGYEMVGMVLEFYFWKGSTIFPWDWYDSHSFLVCCFLQFNLLGSIILCRNVHFFLVLQVKSNGSASILIKGSIASWEHLICREVT